MTRLRLRRALGLLLGLGCWLTLSAQSTKTLLVSAEHTQEPLAAIVADLESRYPIRIYQAVELPATPLTIQWQEVRMDQALKELVEPLGLDVVNYRDQALMLVLAGGEEEAYAQNFYQALDGRLSSGGVPEEAVLIGGDNPLPRGKKATIVGRIVDADTGEPIVGATIYWVEREIGLISDSKGVWETQVPQGEDQLQIQYIGYGSFDRRLNVQGDGFLDIKLRIQATDLATVIVQAEANDDNVTNAQVGLTSLEVKSIEELPALLGEADVVRTLLTGAGVNTVGEGAAGFNVRGGAVDQNLVLQGESILFNSSHALGFFSTINPQVIKGVSLYKSILPAEYGGRLSSVLAVDLRNGNRDGFRMKGGLSPVMGRLSVEGPFPEEMGEGAYLASVRGAYSDWILRRSNVLEVNRSSAQFYDANLLLDWDLTKDAQLRLSAYSAADEFVYNNSFGFNYRTRSLEVDYDQKVNKELSSEMSLVANRFRSEQTNFEGEQAGILAGGISYYKLKEKLRWQSTDEWSLAGGLEAVVYEVPGQKQSPLDSNSILPALALEKERGREFSLFAQGEWSPIPELTLSGGLRLNHYQYLGAQELLMYQEGEAVELNNVVDTVTYGAGEVIQSYTTLEPRLSFLLKVSPTQSIKGGYSRTSQFVNQLFNGATPTPQSQYQLSTPYIKPFLAHNFALGYFHNFQNNRWETSVEGFYRAIDQMWDYRDFADLLINPHIETELLEGQGRAYGAEVRVAGRSLRWNGGLNYTYSRSQQQVAGINLGQWYSSNFDQPHNLNLNLQFKIDARQSITANFVYTSGRPTTAPIVNYRVSGGLIIPVFSERNALRIPDYHRLDVSYTIGMRRDKTKGYRSSWSFTIYNLYARRNAFSVFYSQEPNQSFVANRLAVLGTIFPAITYNFDLR